MADFMIRFFILSLLALPFIALPPIGWIQMFSWIRNPRNFPVSNTKTAMGNAIRSKATK